jgi:replicative DNA helicase
MTQTIVDSKTLADEFVKDQQDRHADPEKYRGYRFPMPWFMQKTGGWGLGWMCYVYGRAGIGKTSVLSTAATQLGKDNVNFLYISLEETLFIVAQRIFSNLEDINRTKFRDITLTQTDWPNVYTAAQQMQKFGGYWAWGLYNEASIIDAVKQVMPDVIIIDYLQLMNMPGKTMTEQISAASKFLVRLAKGHNTGKKHCVIAAAQLNDDNNVLGSRDPDRDGDLILEIADIDDGNGGVLPDKKRFAIRKFRHGGLASTHIAFFGGRSMVGEIAKTANIGAIPRP